MFYYLTMSVGACDSRSLVKVSTVSQGCSHIWRLTCGKICFWLSSVGCWQDPFPHRLLDKGSHSLKSCQPEASFRSLPHGPQNRAAHSMVLRKRGCQRWKPQSFCKLTLQMASHHICHILFIRSKLLGSVHPWKEWITWGPSYRFLVTPAYNCHCYS